MLKVLSSLRARVLLLIAVPFAVLLGTTIQHTLGMREYGLMNARTRVLEAARLIAAKQDGVVEHVRGVLSLTALLPQIGRGVASQECDHALAMQLSKEPNLNTILIALANGDVICNAVSFSGSSSLSDRGHFKAAIQTREFSVGAYMIGRYTGKPGIGFALPLLDEAGIPKAVIATTLSSAWLEQEVVKAMLPEGSRVVVTDGDGLILDRHPDPEKALGQRISDLPLMRDILAKAGAGVEKGISLEGQNDIYGFIPLHRTTAGPEYLWVSVPKAVVTGPAEHSFTLTLLLSVALLVLTFGIFWLGSEQFFVSRIAALAKAARELGKGNLTRHIGFTGSGDEIEQLAQSFDRMADGLHEKEKSLAQAIRALRVLSAGNRAMLHARDGEQRLLEEMCQAIGEAGNFRMVWIGYAEDDEAHSIRPVAHWGNVVEGYFDNVEFSWLQSERALEPSGRAILSGEPVVVQDLQTETGPQPWKDYMLRCGCGSCISLPLHIENRAIGVLNLCTVETAAFSEEEVGLLRDAATELSFGISSQRIAVAQAGMKRALDTAEDRISAAAEANLDALFIGRRVLNESGGIVDFEFTDINLRAAEMLGMAREHIIGQRLCQRFPLACAGGFFDKYVKVATTGTPMEEDVPLDTPDIKAKWLRHQVVRVGDNIAVTARDITARKESEARLKQSEMALARANRALRTLTACNEALTHAESEPEFLSAICRLAVEVGGYCMALVRFGEQDPARTVRVVAQFGGDEKYLEATHITWADTEQGRGPAGTAIRTGVTQVNQNMQTNPIMAPWREAALASGLQASIALPLKGPSATYGALSLYVREPDAFDKEEVQLLEKLADDLTFGITTLRTRLERDRMAYTHQHHAEILRKSLEESIQAIANTLEMRDPYTAGHQKRVAKLAVAIAVELGLPEEQAHGIHLAASIHDLGKIQVPGEILSKPGTLSAIEFMLIKTHAQAGYDILKGIEFPWPIATMVLQHHERLDGSGYPHGLKGEQMLLGSRILAVADVLEAMASHRPYRPLIGIEAALQEIERGRGTEYDPEVVDACLKLFRQEQYLL
jgi:response regulator RpfG family c-di-GMP phosphodiesterase/PAS domain-containing protein